MEEKNIEELIKAEKEKIDNEEFSAEVKAELKVVDNTALEVPKMHFEVDEKKSYNDQAKDVVNVLATQKAIQDETLVEDITTKKKEELKENASANLKNEQAKSAEADKNVATAQYGTFEGVATYAGIKKPLPMKMQKILFTILGCIQTIFLIIIGTPTSILNIFIDCADSIVKKLSSVAKSARILFLSAFGIFIAGAVVLIVIQLFKKYNIVS